MSAIDLLPCPFCGGEAERIDVPAEDEVDGGANAGGSCIQCTRCVASTALHFDRKENLVSSWNERAATVRKAQFLATEDGEFNGNEENDGLEECGNWTAVDPISSEQMAYVIDENSICPIIQWLIDRDQTDAADAVRGLMAREHNAHLAVKEERKIADAAKAEVRALMDKCDNFERAAVANYRRAVEAEEKVATTLDELMQANTRANVFERQYRQALQDFAAVPDITAALRLFVERIEANGEWDDGCFYYGGTSASELQEPLRLAQAALAKASSLPLPHTHETPNRSAGR
jgi:hypothetical protein